MLLERFILRGSAGLNGRDTTTSPPSFMVSVDAKPMPLDLAMLEGSERTESEANTVSKRWAITEERTRVAWRVARVGSGAAPSYRAGRVAERVARRRAMSRVAADQDQLVKKPFPHFFAQLPSGREPAALRSLPCSTPNFPPDTHTHAHTLSLPLSLADDLRGGYPLFAAHIRGATNSPLCGSR